MFSVTQTGSKTDNASPPPNENISILPLYHPTLARLTSEGVVRSSFAVELLAGSDVENDAFDGQINGFFFVAAVVSLEVLQRKDARDHGVFKQLLLDERLHRVGRGEQRVTGDAAEESLEEDEEKEERQGREMMMMATQEVERRERRGWVTEWRHLGSRQGVFSVGGR